MSTTSDHMEAPDVMRLAGVTVPTVDEPSSAKIRQAQQAELDKMKSEMENWRRNREMELHRSVLFLSPSHPLGRCLSQDPEEESRKKRSIL